jgi:tetratricopeptide (TPR) repeat protein
MGTHFQTHTSDMSASLSCSSVAQSVALSESMRQKTSTDGLSGNFDPTNTDVGPDIVGLLTQLFFKGKYELVVEIAEELVNRHPQSFFLHNILGESLAFMGENLKAVRHFEKILQLEPSKTEDSVWQDCKPNVHNNIGVALKSLGLLEESKKHFVKSLQLDPKHAPTYNNYGNLLNEMADLSGAKEKFLKAIELEPSSHIAYWNLHSTTNEEKIATAIIEESLKQAPTFKEAIFTLAGMRAFNGNDTYFNELLSTEFADEPILTSINWILSLPKLPQVHFNRWSMFDHAVELSDTSRPFYEYGVWMGDSFKYLMQYFKKGYGFDTFLGLPEDWRSVPKGAYSSFGKVPNIDGGEFIVGEFQNSLPEFFAKPRPLAGLINFDADLYASTLCALVNSKSIIDEKTVLIFDEFIINSGWEHDEFRALEEFCKANGLDYEVIAVSLYTKQVMVRLVGL